MGGGKPSLHVLWRNMRAYQHLDGFYGHLGNHAMWLKHDAYLCCVYPHYNCAGVCCHAANIENYKASINPYCLSSLS